jgi:hypothetical protein
VGCAGSVSPIVSQAYADWIKESLAAYSFGINRKTDIADLKDNPVPPPTIAAELAPGLYDPHVLQPANIAVYERAVRKNKKGEVAATVWDYSAQIRILGFYVQYTLGKPLVRTSSLMSSEDSSHDM